MTRRALCIGINAYPGAQLAGCVNDARDWSIALARDWRFEEAPMLTDREATRAKMLASIEALLRKSDRNDLAVVCYSGHGTTVVDRDADEIDRVDEALVPVDYAVAGMVLDDDLYRLFAPAEQAGVRTVLIADSCFSGTVARLAPPLATQRQRDGSPSPAYRRVRWLPPAEWAEPGDLDAMARAAGRPRGRPRRSALAVSACRDDQTAAEAWIGGRPRGAFTAAALDALAQVRRTYTLDVEPAERPSYRTWYRLLRGVLPSVDFDQVPQLDGTTTQKRWPLFAERG